MKVRVKNCTALRECVRKPPQQSGFISQYVLGNHSLSLLLLFAFAIWKTPGEGGVELRVQSVFLHREPADLCYKSTPTCITNIIFFSRVSANPVAFN